MFFTPARTSNQKTATPRRFLAMAATLLFALCVLIASAPHRHVGDGLPTRASLSRFDATGTSLQSVEASCALCDWLYAPTLPASAPVMPPVVAQLPLPVLSTPSPIGRLLAATPSRSSSRAPPAA